MRGEAFVLRDKGFTLVEIAVTLAIFAIVLSIAIPSVGAFIASSRAAAGANDLMVAVRAARSEAIARGQTVNLCAASVADGTACATSSPNWANGWLITQSDGTLIKSWGHISGLTLSGTLSSTASISFSGATGTVGSAKTLTLCTPASNGTTVSISANGRSVTYVASSC